MFDQPEDVVPVRERDHLAAGAARQPPEPPGPRLQAQPAHGDTRRRLQAGQPHHSLHAVQQDPGGGSGAGEPREPHQPLHQGEQH